MTEKQKKYIDTLDDFGLIYPFEWYKMLTPNEWIQHAIENSSNIYFTKNAFTKEEKRYILNDKGELELL